MASKIQEANKIVEFLRKNEHRIFFNLMSKIYYVPVADIYQRNANDNS